MPLMSTQCEQLSIDIEMTMRFLDYACKVRATYIWVNINRSSPNYKNVT